MQNAKLKSLCISASKLRLDTKKQCLRTKIHVQLYHFLIPEMSVGGRWVGIFSTLFLMHFNEFSFVCFAERCMLAS